MRFPLSQAHPADAIKGPHIKTSKWHMKMFPAGHMAVFLINGGSFL